jgi:hypothetical protein
MKTEELQQILARYGFKLVRCERKKIVVECPEGIFLKLSLCKPVDRMNSLVLMRWILGRDLYKKFLEEGWFQWDK